MSDQAAVRQPSAPSKLAKHRIVHVVQKYLLNPPIKLLVRRGLHEVWMPGTAICCLTTIRMSDSE
jgi:hypothetical protein